MLLQDHSRLSWKGRGGLWEVPEHWKKAAITHTFRKGGKQDMRNCRLISLTSISAKVIE